jgi:predicted kinase
MAQLEKRLYVSVGIPGSGKSYYFLMMDKMGHVVKRVSRDDVRFSITKPDEKYFAHEKQVYQEYIRQLQEAIDNPGIEWVCADATHLTKKSRQQLFSHLNLRGVNAIYIVWVDTPLEKALERNSRRAGIRNVPEKAIRAMYESFEVPTCDEHPLIQAVIRVSE